MPLRPTERPYGICPVCFGVFRFAFGLANHGGAATAGQPRRNCPGSRGAAWADLTSTDRHGLRLRALSLENTR